MRSTPKDAARGQAGFTLIEMTVALTLIGGVMVGLALLMTGSMAALGAAKQRSAMTEVLNGEIERHRSTKYDEVGVLPTDPDLATQYDAGSLPSTYAHDGRDAVIASGPAVLPAVSQYPAGEPVPYTIERWVTWTDTTGGTSHQFKRIDLRVTWMENLRVERHISFSTVVYPGGLGAPTVVNNPPTATFTASDTNPAIGSLVTFTATASDPDGDALSYSWDFGDGVVSTAGATVSHSYGAAGIYSATLTVFDAGGLTVAPSPQTITVPSPLNQPPVIGSVTVTGVGTRTDLINASATATDPEGDSLTYAWDWGDSSTSTGNNVGHTYAALGSYVVTLTVYDQSNAVTDTRSWVVTSLACSITAASFENPTGSTTLNDIELGNGANANKPKKATLKFSVTVVNGSACTSTSLQGRIPTTTATPFTIALSRVGSTDVWSGTVSNFDSYRINIGNNQTAEAWTPSGTGSGQKFAFSFDAN